MKKIYKVRALVLDHDGSTLAIEADHPRVLQLPGGSRKPKENPVKALRRELREETGHRIGSIRHVRRFKVNRNGCREITDFGRPSERADRRDPRFCEVPDWISELAEKYRPSKTWLAPNASSDTTVMYPEGS